MNKLIILAALLGFTLSKESFDFWTQGNPTGMGKMWSRGVLEYEWFDMSTFSEIDFGFGTLFKRIDNN